jgi:hypothetical protein
MGTACSSLWSAHDRRLSRKDHAQKSAAMRALFESSDTTAPPANTRQPPNGAVMTVL